MHIYETFKYTRWTRSDFFVKQRLFYKVDGDFDTIGLMVTLCVAFLKVLQKSIRVQLDKAPGVRKKNSGRACFIVFYRIYVNWTLVLMALF